MTGMKVVGPDLPAGIDQLASRESDRSFGTAPFFFYPSILTLIILIPLMNHHDAFLDVSLNYRESPLRDSVSRETTTRLLASIRQALGIGVTLTSASQSVNLDADLGRRLGHI